MIDFTFPPEVEKVRMQVREFMDTVVRPQWDAIDQHDRSQVVKTIVKLRKVAREDWNLWLPHMPAEWGGMGLGPTAMAAVSAEAAKVSIGPFVLNAQAPDEGNQHTLLHWATPEQKENGIDFMENIALQGKTNFFEKKVSEYQKSGILNKNTDTFAFGEDF
jgi:acyl-CoA dehydrogenase